MKTVGRSRHPRDWRRPDDANADSSSSAPVPGPPSPHLLPTIPHSENPPDTRHTTHTSTNLLFLDTTGGGLPTRPRSCPPPLPKPPFYSWPPRAPLGPFPPNPSLFLYPPIALLPLFRQTGVVSPDGNRESVASAVCFQDGRHGREDEEGGRRRKRKAERGKNPDPFNAGPLRGATRTSKTERVAEGAFTE